MRSSALFVTVLLLFSTLAVSISSNRLISKAQDEVDVALMEVLYLQTVVEQGTWISPIDPSIIMVMRALAPILIGAENQGTIAETFNVTAYYNGTAILTERWIDLDGGNSNTFWGMGDVNRDGYIDSFDAYIIGREVGWIGMPGQNYADINLDGKVSVLDAIKCAQNVGRNIWDTLGLEKIVDENATLTLPSGYRALTWFRWNTTGMVTGNYPHDQSLYVINASATVLPGETDIADNTLDDGTVTVAMPGDCNADGVVDIFDIVTVAVRFGFTYASPLLPWNPKPDQDTNGEIDIYDIEYSAVPFGTQYGTP